MGGGGSKKPKDPKQEKVPPKSTKRIKSNESSPRSSSPESPPPTLTEARAPSKRSSNRSRQPPSIHSPSSQNHHRSTYVLDEVTNGRTSKTLNNGIQPATSFSNHDSDSDSDGTGQLVTNNNFHQKSKSNSIGSTPRPPSNRSRINSSTLPKLVTKTPTIPTDETGRCRYCLHCQRVPRAVVRQSPSPPPPWIVKSHTNQSHINMDRYDEEAVRKKLISDHGHFPGSYQYAPNLIIEEEEDDQTNPSKKYSTLPSITKPGSSLTPSRTPFPNYDTLERRERRLNRPYSTTLYTD